eukprot:CAMPEP_0114979626 /NCGR_PEP_ID=MMETSP0216-20121206/4476_1 /TAXON_ID=223996 /ORGANISM="Protocruzia adherens, Strain Boccale" /LENGTH=384 /DNA_ID=CAMNT_0002340973 /DNA_START=215 /DNA_END=1369 /DNA_ORIENTATION=-
MWGKKKPTHSGFEGDLSPEMEQSLKEFRETITNEDILPKKFDQDWTLLRFLRARNFDMKKTLEMWRNFINWRKEFGVDDIAENFDFHEKDAVKENYPHGYHKTDKLGRPIYIERLGSMNIKKVFEITTKERMLKYYVREYERVLTHKFPACEKATGRTVQQSFTILDMKGLPLGQVNSVKNFIQQATSIAQDYYPEMLGRMYIVNAPMLFTGVWAIVKVWVDPKTRAKITILGGKYQNQLLEHVEAENLPTWLGGTSECDDFLINEAGPWCDPQFNGEAEKKAEEKKVDEVEDNNKEAVEPKEETTEDKKDDEETKKEDDEDKKEDEDDEEEDEDRGAKLNDLKNLLSQGAMGDDSAKHHENATPMNTQAGDDDDNRVLAPEKV